MPPPRAWIESVNGDAAQVAVGLHVFPWHQGGMDSLRMSRRDGTSAVPHSEISVGARVRK